MCAKILSIFIEIICKSPLHFHDIAEALNLLKIIVTDTVLCLLLNASTTQQKQRQLSKFWSFHGAFVMKQNVVVIFRLLKIFGSLHSHSLGSSVFIVVSLTWKMWSSWAGNLLFKFTRCVEKSKHVLKSDIREMLNSFWYQNRVIFWDRQSTREV